MGASEYIDYLETLLVEVREEARQEGYSEGYQHGWRDRGKWDSNPAIQQTQCTTELSRQIQEHWRESAKLDFEDKQRLHALERDNAQMADIVDEHTTVCGRGCEVCGY